MDATEAKSQIVIEGRLKMAAQLGTGQNNMFHDFR